MNTVESHLLITHLPIFGSILGVLVLIYGLLTDSRHTQMAAFLLFILSSTGAIFAYITGNDVENIIRNIKGISQNSMMEHVDFANYSMVLLFLLGVVSIIALSLSAKESPYIKKLTPVVLVIALLSFVLVIRTGYLGGQIRHFEVTDNTIIEAPAVVVKKSHLISYPVK